MVTLRNWEQLSFVIKVIIIVSVITLGNIQQGSTLATVHSGGSTLASKKLQA